MGQDKGGSNGGGCIGFGGLLTIVFIVLKLLGKIAWSWVWVLSPLWIGAALLVSILILASVGLKLLGSSRRGGF